MKKYIHINNCYGRFCTRLKREYESPAEFFKDLEALDSLPIENIKNKFKETHPLKHSKPILVEMDLHETEGYYIEEVNGLETIYFYKRNPILSTQKVIQPNQ